MIIGGAHTDSHYDEWHRHQILLTLYSPVACVM